MNSSSRRLEFKFQRTIPAPPDSVFDAWLNPKIPVNTWNAAEEFILDAKGKVNQLILEQGGRKIPAAKVD